MSKTADTRLRIWRSNLAKAQKANDTIRIEAYLRKITVLQVEQIATEE